MVSGYLLQASAHIIVNELWHLMEAECEELRVLQTLTPLVSTELLVTGQWLAKVKFIDAIRCSILICEILVQIIGLLCYIVFFSA